MRLLIILLLSISCLPLSAQRSDLINYQAVVRNESGDLVRSSPVTIQVSISQRSADGAVVFEEFHRVTSTENGLISFQIGNGEFLRGYLDEINWPEGPYFLTTKIDPNGGQNYTLITSTQLLSVPYALHASTAATITDPISAQQVTGLRFFTGEDIAGNEPAFAGWDKNAEDDFTAADIIGNEPAFASWDKNAEDDFSGEDIVGNEPAFANWDKNAEDDFTAEDIVGNERAFASWDKNVEDDFSGDWRDLNNRPRLYSQSQVDSIKRAIVDSLLGVINTAVPIQHLTRDRALNQAEIGNTLVCDGERTLRIPQNFRAMKVGQTINLEIHGGVLTIAAAAGVKLNGASGRRITKGDGRAYTGGLIRKTATNAYVVL